jgi:Domain of unknown function (DUF4136)
MRPTPLLSLLALVIPAACAPGVQVRTAAAPDAHLTNLRTFIVMATPSRRARAGASDEVDPMLENSITYHALHADLISNFQEHGYVIDSAKPDFAVAAYASARQKLDVTQYDYGYPYWRYRWWGPLDYPEITQYTEGTVVIDVIDPKTKDLLWRGQGVASVSDDPQVYAKELAKTVAKIVDRFPPAAPATVAESR